MLKYPELNANIGVLGGTSGGRAWEVGTLVAGAWREDEEDVIYKYEDIVEFDGGGISITHFWDPDDGDYNKNTFQLTVGGVYIQLGSYENAYEKMGKFVNGGWDLLYNYDSATGCPSNAFGVLQNTPITGILFSYLDLVDFYLTGRAYTKGYRDINGSVHTTTPSIIYFGEAFRKKITWQVLGRMCHLLQDMSVPAHVHRDCHGISDEGIRQDSYEEMFCYDSDFYYDSPLVFSEYGSFLNPIEKTDPNVYHCSNGRPFWQRWTLRR